MENRENAGPEIKVKGDAPKKPRAKRQPKVVTDEQLTQFHKTVVLMVNGVLLFIPDQWKPLPNEIDSIFQPAERLYLRHADVPEVSEDVTDGFLFIVGLSQYLIRVAVTPPGLSSSGVRGPMGSGGVGGRASSPSPAPAPAAYTPPTEPVPVPEVNGQVQEEEEIRFARPGEGTGLPPEAVQGDPSSVMHNLHAAAYTEEAAVDLSSLRGDG